MAFIDPTELELTGNTDYENLNIYVDLSVQRRGINIINADTKQSQSIASGVINLMGFNNNENRIFTTDYTEIYREGIKGKGYSEGFGITNISIEVNSSYVPIVKIDFVDIKGMSFFNKDKDSPYSVLFDFPPPIYTLKVKGYYGYALEYKLHLLRQNTIFDSETGNYKISAEFVGNTFAPLADILYQYVLTSSTLDGEQNDTDARNAPRNLKELVQRSKKIKKEITTKLDEKVKNINEISSQIDIINSLIKNDNDLEGNIKHVEIPSTLVDPKPLIKTESFRIGDYNPNSSYYLIIPIKQLNNFIPTENSILKEYYKQTFITQNKNIYFNSPTINNITIIRNNEGNISNIKVEDQSIFYIEITSLYNYINDLLQKEYEKYSDKEEDIQKNLSDIVTTGLGFQPTIKNVMEIICNDIDRWVSKLGDTYNNSVDFIEKNRNQFRRIFEQREGESILPFPDYIEGGNLTIPDINISGDKMYEVKLVDDFIDAFVQNKLNQKNEPVNTESVVDLNGNNIWFPVNPLDSSFYDKSNKSPYNNLLTPQDIIRIIFARYYVFNYFTLTSGNTDQEIFPNIIANFFENEFDNIVNTINQPKLLEGLKNLQINNIKNSLFSILEKQFIKKEDIDKILRSIDVDINTEFSGIVFTPSKNILNIDIDFSKINKGFFQNYLNDNPKNLTNNLSGGKYELKQLKSSDFGLTLNKENNIIYYDGDNKDKTSFIGINETNNFNNIILDSLNFKTVYKTILNTRIINKSLLIRESYNINKIIYNQYFDSNNEFKTFFGYINIIYIPNLRHIMTVLMNKAIICEMPFLVKLYVSAYVYGIENNLIDVNESDQEFNKFDNENRDFIYNVFKVNSRSSRNDIKNLFNNHVNIRIDFINLLKNLTKKDKDLFIDFYEKTIINNTLFKNKFIDLIGDLINKNFFQEDLEAKETDLLKLDDINNFSILDNLKKKTNIIVKSNYTFADKTNFNIFTNFQNLAIINQNLNKNFDNSQFRASLIGLISKFNNTLDDRIKDLKNQNDNNLLTSKKNRDSFNNIRTETYYSFKTFVDRWMIPLNGDKVDTSRGFLLTDNNGGKESKFFDLFSFVDRWYNNTDAENIIIDTTILSEFESDLNVNMLTVISRLLNDNGFEFYPLQNFINYTNTKDAGLNSWNNSVIFNKYIGGNNVLSGPRFTCMYIGGKSRYLDSDFNKNSTFKNDGFTSDNLPDDIPGNDSRWFGFIVKFGDGRQSVFSQIELNTEEHQPTNESLSAMSQILDTEGATPVPTNQNLFTTYEQRSYTCRVKMFGNVMIQPTQLFDLRNVPMFNGVYIILKVNHTIDSDTNSMITQFEGVRLPKNRREFILEPYEIYGKNLLPNLDGLMSGRRTKSSRQESRLQQDDRKIYLVAGHNTFNDPGAEFETLDGSIIREGDLTIELRDLIKNSLTSKNIEVEVDDDSKKLAEVIVDLETKVQSNDIVIDIHFNSNEGTAGSGTEVFIKDGTNTFTNDLGSKIVSEISRVLGIRKRDATGNLPKGVKTPIDSARGTLGIFELNTNVVLIEVCFINNPREMRIYQQKKNELAVAIGNVLIETTKTNADRELLNVQTFGILNTLKYNNINNRNNPHLLVNKNKIKTNISNILGNKYYNYKPKGGKVTEATVFKNISKSDYLDFVLNQIEMSSQKHGLDSMFLAGILFIESKFFPSAISSTGAIGISQFTSSAFVDVFRKLQNIKNTTTNVYVLNNNNQFENKIISYSDVILLFFNTVDINFNTISGDDFKNKYRDSIIKKVYNNPFIMIELAAIYLKIVEVYSKTNKNKNMSILSISYNMGTITSNYNENADKVYFENLRAKYNAATKEDERKKIVRLIPNEGIEYPERLINEFLLPNGIINKSDLVKENII